MSKILTLLCALFVASPCWAASGLLNPMLEGIQQCRSPKPLRLSMALLLGIPYRRPLQ